VETWSIAHAKLQTFCADFWPDAASCRRLLADTGVSEANISFDEPPLLRWFSILRQLMKLNDGSMGRLVTTLLADYPENDALRTVCAPWIAASPAGIPGASFNLAPVPEGVALVQKFIPAPSVEVPIGVPVVAPMESAEEAALMVARMDTLWAAMIEQERRMAELEAWARAYPFLPPVAGMTEQMPKTEGK